MCTADAPRPPFLDESSDRILIGGVLRAPAAGDSYEVINPANAQLVATAARSTVADVDSAVAVARAAFEGPWRASGPQERQRVLLRLADLVVEHVDELALLETLEMGAPLKHARGGILLAAQFLQFYAAASRTITGETIENSRATQMFSYTLKEPVGVVGAITPWNSPVLSATWKIGPALAAGCTVVHKPASQSPFSALRFGTLCLEAGVPEGVVNVVVGNAQVGAALAAHLDVDKITFTGSIDTGQEIVRLSAGNVKRLTLELGGKSPNIVLADADLDRAARAAALGIFAGSGQVCVAPSRLYVQRPVYEEFTARVAEIGRSLVVGDPLDPKTDLGPLASDWHLARVLRYVEAGRDEGARLLTGGERLADPSLAAGYYVAPTVFADVRDDMRIAREEIFGPVLSALPFDDIDEVVKRANATGYGLAAYIWTRSVSSAHQLAARIQAGIISINSVGNLDPAVPVGGYKMSGYGRELGLHHLDEYLNVKSVWIRKT